MLDDDEAYVVESVLAKRPDEKYGEVFLVKWEGYSHQHNSWEPRESFISSAHLIDEYEEDCKVCLCIVRKFCTLHLSLAQKSHIFASHAHPAYVRLCIASDIWGESSTSPLRNAGRGAGLFSATEFHVKNVNKFFTRFARDARGRVTRTSTPRVILLRKTNASLTTLCGHVCGRRRRERRKFGFFDATKARNAPKMTPLYLDTPKTYVSKKGSSHHVPEKCGEGFPSETLGNRGWNPSVPRPPYPQLWCREGDESLAYAYPLCNALISITSPHQPCYVNC